KTGCAGHRPGCRGRGAGNLCGVPASVPRRGRAAIEKREVQDHGRAGAGARGVRGRKRNARSRVRSRDVCEPEHSRGICPGRRDESEMSSSPQNGSHDDRPYLEFQHVSKSFGSKHVLRDVSWAVKAGETMCILGRSGVGKSVSLHNIMGFLKPDEGRIWVAYEDITDYGEA